ncbi:SDR family oxidoreductase [Nocardiopsis alkaliphila]|uniref:SDR family oxidoreductase n=1 Tax=Nocardiopsis alkaliphila TaxID=225762 RepID=UPI00034BA2DA|nr:NAD(P)H-binding protein [Nocardiopsis alkaliphila]
MILVLGATGTVGRPVVEELVEQGHRVRALSRTPEHAGLPEKVEVLQGSVSEGARVVAALEGVRSVFVILSGDVAGQAAALAEAVAGSAPVREGCLEHIVLLSSASVLHPLEHGIADDHRRAEEAVRDIGVPWTFLRPGPFHSNSTWWAEGIRETGVARCLIGNQPGAPIDESDIAAAAVTVLTGEGHGGRSYELTGPEVITSAEQVAVIGDVLDRDLGFEVAPPERVVDVFTSITGDREAAITNVRALHSPQVPWAQAKDTVERLTGRPPRAFREWVRDNAGLFR